MPHVLIALYCNVYRNSRKATEYAEVSKYLHVHSQLMCVLSLYCTTYLAVVAKINTGWSVVLNLALAGCSMCMWEDWPSQRCAVIKSVG